jgi:hypothetical protein
MSRKKSFITVIPLIFFVLLAGSCKLKDVTQPDPFGPGTMHLALDLEAYPNVLYMTSSRQQAEIRATVKLGGKPAPGEVVFFTVDSGPGEFSDYKDRTSVTTDQNGVASVTYLSPTGGEISRDTFVTIKAQIQTASPDYQIRYVDIRLLRH